jgi:hypothetical protein
VVEEQLAHLADEADEARLRALVSETPLAGQEHREAQRHADAMRRHRDALVAELAELDHTQNDLLDRLVASPPDRTPTRPPDNPTQESNGAHPCRDR